MVRIYCDKSGTGEFVVQTTASDVDAFIGELAEALDCRGFESQRRRLVCNGHHKKRDANCLQARGLQSRNGCRATHARVWRRVAERLRDCRKCGPLKRIGRGESRSSMQTCRSIARNVFPPAARRIVESDCADSGKYFADNDAVRINAPGLQAAVKQISPFNSA